jgi:hypothetical protein
MPDPILRTMPPILMPNLDAALMEYGNDIFGVMPQAFVEREISEDHQAQAKNEVLTQEETVRQLQLIIQAIEDDDVGLLRFRLERAFDV